MKDRGRQQIGKTVYKKVLLLLYLKTRILLVTEKSNYAPSSREYDFYIHIQCLAVLFNKTEHKFLCDF